jgi:site-specific DNA-cytosine methylase
MYGSKVEVPSAIDILIAGFACDDFSTLNNVRKKLTEKGESGDTFFAVRAYMVKYTPLMVILENVIGAPWVPKYDKKTGDRIYPKKLKSHKQNKSIQEYVDEAGYFSIFFRVDTKDFAIPQTRIRGYMVCVLKSAISEGMDWKLLKKDCENLVEALKRSASAPVEAMLFPPDHPALKSIHGEIKSDKKPVDWDKCSMGHGDYSRELGLGNKHPITNWKTDGSRILPDFHIPMACMTERVADTVDIAHKRSLQRGFDDTKYK